MKRIIYGSILIALVAALWVFLSNPPVTTTPADARTLALTFSFPEGYELTPGAPFKLSWQAENPQGNAGAPVLVRNFDPFVLPYRFVVTPPSGAVGVVLRAHLYYCDKKTRMCFQDDFNTRVEWSGASGGEIPVKWGLVPQQKAD